MGRQKVQQETKRWRQSQGRREGRCICIFQREMGQLPCMREIQSQLCVATGSLVLRDGTNDHKQQHPPFCPPFPSMPRQLANVATGFSFARGATYEPSFYLLSRCSGGLRFHASSSRSPVLHGFSPANRTAELMSLREYAVDVRRSRDNFRAWWNGIPTVPYEYTEDYGIVRVRPSSCCCCVPVFGGGPIQTRMRIPASLQ